jgi:lipid-A-disaccharide synthase
MNVYLIAGESSGDAHAAVLMSELQQLEPAVQFFGAGGPKMRAVGGPGIFDWAHEAVVGVWDVAMKYPYFRRQFYRMHAEIQEMRPDIVLFVDYPGFNLRLSRHLRRTGYKGKLVYYISPQVWAWYRGRIRHMAKFLDLMMCIFPFEKTLYEAAGLHTEFVGHPMIEALMEKRLSVDRDPDLVGLFPGSREREVRRILPTMLASAELLRERKPEFRFEVSAASERLKGLIHEILTAAGHAEWPVEIRRATELMQRAVVGLVASGTATMEASFFELPFVLLYKVAWTTFVPGRLLVRVKYLGMPNILAGKPIIPEFIQHQAVPENIAAAVWRLYGDPVARTTQIQEMRKVIEQVASVPAGGRPADVLLRFARSATRTADAAPAR